MEIKVGRLHEMVLLILIIGMFNIYDILKNINISVYDVININEKNILYLVTLILFFTASLFFFKSNFLKKDTGGNSLEFELILGLGLIGIYVLLLSNDLLLFFLALELYSLSVYLLLFKNNKKESKITILYFLLGSISSSFILLGIALLYNSTGSLDIKYIFQNIDIISSYLDQPSVGGWVGLNNIPVGLALFFCGLLFKIGSAPFQFWVIKVYTQMDLKILMYQSIVPKIAYIFLFSSFLNYLNNSLNAHAAVIKLLLLSAFLSLFIGPIGAISKGVNKYKKLIAYSSIFHVGYLLLGLVANNYLSLHSCGNAIFSASAISQYLLIYGFNTLQFGLVFFFLPFCATTLTQKMALDGWGDLDQKEKVQSPNYVGGPSLNKPLLLFFLLISIFSFIGLPPFGGFYAKLNIVLNCLYTNNTLLQFFAILFIIFSTLIAAFLYLKFFHFFFFSPSALNPTLSIGNYTLSHYKNSAYLLSFLSLFLLVYPIYLPYFLPIFELLAL